MNVTRKNFAEHLPEILAKIEAADLVAIDLEFTGLPNDKDFNQLDTREERYQKTAHQMATWFMKKKYFEEKVFLDNLHVPYL